MGLLSSISDAVKISNEISYFGPHGCFGYQVLENSFKSLIEIFGSVIELCGTEDLTCPRRSSPSSSPDRVSISPPPLRALASKSTHGNTIITSADYFTSEEEINEWISKLQREEEGRVTPGFPSVICDLLIHYPITDYLNISHHLQGQRQQNE